MRIVQKMLTKMSRLSGSNSLRCATMRHQIVARLKRRPTVADRRFMQNMNEEVKKPGSALLSMREFFMHPQTWDRNNGYFNVVLALSIFGFCFFNSCCPSEEKVVATDKLPVPSKK